MNIFVVYGTISSNGHNGYSVLPFYFSIIYFSEDSMNLFLQSLKEYLKKTDWFLLIFSLVTSIYGLVLIYSATRSFNSDKYMYVQIAALVMGIIIFFVVGTFNFEQLSHFWIPILFFNLLFLMSVLFFGEAGDSGNTSWIRFDALGIGIQPGEIGKLLFIFTFSKHISLVGEKINHPLSVLALLAHGGATVLAAYIFSKDLGMAITYLLIMAIMLIASGLSLKWIVPMGGLSLASVPFIWKYVLKDYQRLRIEVVWNPEASEKYAYHAKQAKIAIGSGGLTGCGFLQGKQTQYALLPAKHTDFIFAVCTEEFGLVGCAILMALLSAIILKIFYNALKMNDTMSFCMCIGIGAMFLSQTLINIGMCAGVAPVIGLTLPFVSYGGSSLVTNFCAIGMLSSLLIHNRPRRVMW